MTVYEFCLVPDDTPITPRNDTLNLHPPSKGPPGAALKPKWKLKDAVHYKKCAEFAKHKIPPKHESPGQILFMRGHPTAEWVAHVGSAHRVDPEFFSRWLNFPHGDDQPNNHSLPSLPSSGWNILELPLISIGGHASSKDFKTQGDLDDARRQSANAVRMYHNNLYTSNEAPGCTSVARDVCLFDEDNFAVEQKITICMQPSQDATKDSVAEPKGWVCKLRI